MQKIKCPKCGFGYEVNWKIDGLFLTQIIYTAFCKKCGVIFDLIIAINDEKIGEIEIKLNKSVDYIG